MTRQRAVYFKKTAPKQHVWSHNPSGINYTAKVDKY